VPWLPAAGETALAQGAVPEAKRGTALLQGAAGQFAASMKGYWITVRGVDTQGASRTVTTQIMGVADDGSRVSLVQNFVEDLDEVTYSVHQKIQPIQTLTEFAKALNDSGLLGEEKVTFNATTGDLVLPVRFAGALADLQTPIRFVLGEDSPISLTTTATGLLKVDVNAGFDLVLGLGGEEIELAIDRLQASADLRLAVENLEVAAQLGFLTMAAGGVGSGSGITRCRRARPHPRQRHGWRPLRYRRIVDRRGAQQRPVRCHGSRLCKPEGTHGSGRPCQHDD
jgi:hypothetical protein